MSEVMFEGDFCWKHPLITVPIELLKDYAAGRATTEEIAILISDKFRGKATWLADCYWHWRMVTEGTYLGRGHYRKAELQGMARAYKAMKGKTEKRDFLIARGLIRHDLYCLCVKRAPKAKENGNGEPKEAPEQLVLNVDGPHKWEREDVFVLIKQQLISREEALDLLRSLQ